MKWTIFDTKSVGDSKAEQHIHFVINFEHTHTKVYFCCTYTIYSFDDDEKGKPGVFQ